MSLNKRDFIESINKNTALNKEIRKWFFTENFLKKIENALNKGNTSVEETIKNLVENRIKAIKRLKNYKENKLINEKFSEYENVEINPKVVIWADDILKISELEKNDLFQKYFSELTKNDENLGLNIITTCITKFKQNKFDDIEKTLTFNKNIAENPEFAENKNFYLDLIKEEEFQEFLNFILQAKSKIDFILKDEKNQKDLEINLNVLDNKSFRDLENFLREINYDFNWNLNKQHLAKENLNSEQLSSWNRHIVAWENTELISENEIEKLEEISALYLDFCNSISDDKELRKRLMSEVSIDEKLENIYFRPLTKKDIVRIDATIWDNNAIYEFDDFPRWVCATYLFEKYKNWESSWVKQFKESLNPWEKILFLIHETASWACHHEHREMARLLNEKEDIDAIYCDSKDFLENFENREDGIYYNWEKIGAVWHHLMVTPEATEILPILDEKNVSILPNYHFSSNKWIQAIIWEKYKSWKLDEKYLPLVEEGFFAESVKLESLEQSFSFAWKNYNSLEEFFTDEENIKNNFKNVVFKTTWAENAEWVTVFAILTWKKLKEEIEKLKNILENGLKSGETILLQENKPHTVKSVPVYNSTEENFEIFEWNSINRLFLNWEWKIICGMSQITKSSKIEEKNGKKLWYGTAHWMIDMVIENAK